MDERAIPLSADAPSRVLQLSPIPFSDEAVVGGGERYPTELSRAMARYVPTTLVSLSEKGSSRHEGNLTIKIYPALKYVGGKRVNPLSPWFLLDVLRAPVVHCHQYQTLMANMGVLLGSLVGKRTFITDHGGGGRNYARRLGIDRRLTALLAVSHFSASFFPDLSSKTTIIGSGVNPNHFRCLDLDRNRSVLYVGRLLPNKGIDYLIQAVRPDTPLRLVGRPYDPVYLQRLRHLADGKHVEFITEATDEDILREYNSASVTVLASVFRSSDGVPRPMSELLGITLLESMACETPVVCTKVGGMPEAVLDEVTGFVVRPNDPDALAAAVYRLLDDPAKARSMGKAGRQHVLENWTWDLVARRCLEAYEGLRAED